MTYRLFVIDDQAAQDTIEQALRADRERGAAGEPFLELAGIARSSDEAFERVIAADPPFDVIVLDDYLLEGDETAGKALDLMSDLCEHWIAEAVPLHRRPRCVLYTSTDPLIVYTFCALGGLQYQDRRAARGLEFPVGAVWRALAGERWMPPEERFPAELGEKARRILPWLAAGRTAAEITQATGAGTHATKDLKDKIRAAIDAASGGPTLEHPSIAEVVRFLRRHGWAWVPLEYHRLIPAGAPLPLTLDPSVHAQPLDPAGPLPARATPRNSGEDA